MKTAYRVIALTKDDRWVLLNETYDTKLEAETFIGIERTQMEWEDVKEAIVAEEYL